ncbi:amidohydrolase family protein [Actinopolymorpha alba]|uniref:amidohydrolase family protein n=1 Tax=Actinopolymorpha alba TaxID=533267 RepID=UPI0003A83C70|nr:amidohydrolase family protein [Actinopolymorpha alba]
MIIDVHSHLFDHYDQLGEPFRGDSARARAGEVDLLVRYEDYASTAPPDTRTIVVGGKAMRSGLWVPDRAVADYTAAYPELIGFLSLDPTQPGWRDELEHGHRDLGLRGIKLMPMYAGFDPADPVYDDLYAYAERNGLPLLVHTGTTFVRTAPLRWALPVHLDEVAIRHPGLRMVLAHLGHPFEGECIAVIRKHPHVYADVSALHYAVPALARAPAGPGLRRLAQATVRIGLSVHHRRRVDRGSPQGRRRTWNPRSRPARRRPGRAADPSRIPATVGPDMTEHAPVSFDLNSDAHRRTRRGLEGADPVPAGVHAAVAQPGHLTDPITSPRRT